MSGVTGRVLVVDDEDDVRCTIVKMVRRMGHAVQGVGSGEEAREVQECKPVDLILLDLKMPGMGGIEFLRLFKTRNVPGEVIILTAFPDEETIREAMQLGAYDYLVKPLNPHLFHAKIHQVMERQEARRLKKRLATIASIAEVSRADAGKVVALRPDERREEIGAVPPHQNLSLRQFQVLRGIGMGLNIKELADSLGLSEKTVRAYRGAIREKMGLYSDGELMRYTLKHGLVD